MRLPTRTWQAAGAFGLLVVITMLVGGPGVAPALSGVSVVASVDGQPLGTSSQNRPVKLLPRQQSVLTITVTNAGASTIGVGEVRLEGDVVGLTFFAYDTAVSMSVAPGTSASARLDLDLSGLNGQATGLIPGVVKILDSQHDVLAQQNGVVDVRGSLRSVYGLFGLGVAFLTALSFGGALVGLARHRLPPNRWRRGLRFLTPGLGLGLVVNFTLSATRVFVPEIGRWVTITFLSAVILFGLGYLTPTPDLEEDEPEEVATQVIEEVTVVAIAGRPGHFALPPQPPMGQLVPDRDAQPAFAAAQTDPQLPVGSAPPRPDGLVRAADPAPPAPTDRPAPVPGVAEPPAAPDLRSDARATLPIGFTPTTGFGAPTPPPTTDTVESTPNPPADTRDV